MNASTREHTWLVVMVVPIKGTNPTRAYEDFTGRANEVGALFLGSPLVADERDIEDPDFDVSVRSHGRTLEHEDELGWQDS